MKKKIVLFICFSFLMFSFFAGCQSSAEKPLLPDQENNQSQDNNIITDDEKKAMASRLANMAESVEGVDRATVVVSNYGGMDTSINNQEMRNNLNNNIRNNSNISLQNNNNNNGMTQVVDVMVGLDLNTNVTNDMNKERAIKKSVASKLQDSDKRISQVTVTSDPDLKKEIDDITAGLSAGKPLQNFSNEINNLNKKIMNEMD